MDTPITPKACQGWSLDDREPEVIASLLSRMKCFYDHYFRVQTGGWHHVPSGKALFVGAHNGGLAAPDMHMFMYDWFRRFGPERPFYGLMHPDMWRFNSGIAELATQTGAIRAHPKMAIMALQQGASVAVFPGGVQDVFRPHYLRDRIHFCDRKGFIKLALRESVPIIPFISWGAHDTLVVLADIYEQVQKLHEMGMPWLFKFDPMVFPIYLGLPWGLCLGPLPNVPWPAQIHTQICAPIVFEHYGKQVTKDKTYVQACYDTVVTKMQMDLDQLIVKAQR